MRKELLLILILVMAAALIAYNWPGGVPLLLRTPRGVVKTETTADGSPSDVPSGQTTYTVVVNPKKSAPARKAAIPATPSLVESAPTPVEPTPTGAACCRRPDTPFPTPEILTRGSTAAEIRGAYGAPTIDVAGSRDGRVLEKYYYMSPDRTHLTVANIENGLLISAESLSSPYFRIPSAGRGE
jgi:hypothetical protein